jgi:hypothetical protein
VSILPTILDDGDKDVQQYLEQKGTYPRNMVPEKLIATDTVTKVKIAFLQESVKLGFESKSLVASEIFINLGSDRPQSRGSRTLQTFNSYLRSHSLSKASSYFREDRDIESTGSKKDHVLMPSRFTTLGSSSK